MVDIAQRDPEQIPAMLSAGYALVDARLAFFDSIEAGFAQREAAQAAQLETIQ